MSAAIGNEVENQPRQRPSTLWLVVSILAIAGAVIAGLAILYLRSVAANLDFGLVNVLTGLLSILAWFSLVVGLWASSLPRILWRTTCLLPILVAAGFMSLYRVDRVDGEMRPKFVSRWAEEAELPGSGSQASATVEAELIAARPTDFPQFLGPNRDGMLDGVIAEDWDASPPTIAWKQPIGEGWSSFAIQGDLAVTMEQRDDEEWVSAYNMNDGALVWSYSIPGMHSHPAGGTGPRATPTISGDRVYASSAVSHFACLDLASGEKLWSQELGELSGVDQGAFEEAVSWGRSGSALVFDRTVVVPLGGSDASSHALVAFEADTGNVLWNAGEGQVSYSSPLMATLAGQRQILYVSENRLSGYDVEDGAMLWQVDAPAFSNSSPNVSQPLLVGQGRILLTKGYGEGARLLQVSKAGDAWDVAEVWKRQPVLRTKFTSCVMLDNYAYGLSDGILQCVDLADGTSVWKRGRYRQGQLLLVGRHLLITAENGDLALVSASPDAYEELARMPVIGDVTWNTPALSGNRLLMRNSDEVACVHLPMDVASKMANTEGQTE